MSRQRIKVKIGSALSEEVEVDVGLVEGRILSLDKKGGSFLYVEAPLYRSQQDFQGTLD